MEKLIENFKQRGSSIVAAILTSRTPSKKGGFILKKPMAWNGSFLLLPAILVVIVCVASHCEKPVKPEQPPVNTSFPSIEWKFIGQGNVYSSDGLPEQYSVIKNSTDWLSLIAAMDAYNNTSSSFTETNIDFSQFSIIVVIDEVKGNGGWTIDVTDITENSDNIVITVENSHKGNISSVMTQAFQIVKIPVSNKRIIFNKQLIRN